MNDKNIPVRILSKDIDNNIIYEIFSKISEENMLIKNGVVIDHRTGEILMVNFDNNNIITDILNDFPLFQNKNEYNSYINNIIPQKENILKKQLLQIDKIINDDNYIEGIAEEINKEITKEKIKNLGIKNQGYMSECWVYSLSLLICMINARKFGRKNEDFDKTYDYIIKKYNKNGKTNKEMNIIMKEILKQYNLKHEIVNDESILKDCVKNGFKCLTTFKLNKLEWHNFSDFSNNFKEGKVLTKEILEKENNKNTINPNDEGHAVILSDIDEEDNYILINSWGKDWGNNGTFKVKKECLKNSTFFVVFYEAEQLTNEEKDSLIKLKDDIKKRIKELKYIRCPSCRECNIIEQFDIIGSLKCPSDKNCLINLEGNNAFRFIVDQLLSYELYTKKDFKEKFNYGFG